MSLPGIGGIGIGPSVLILKASAAVFNFIRPSIPLDVQNGNRVENHIFTIHDGDDIQVVALTKLPVQTVATLNIFTTTLSLSASAISSGRLGKFLKSRRRTKVVPSFGFGWLQKRKIVSQMTTMIDENGIARWVIPASLYASHNVVGFGMTDPVRSNFTVVIIRASNTITPTPKPPVSGQTMFHRIRMFRDRGTRHQQSSGCGCSKSS